MNKISLEIDCKHDNRQHNKCYDCGAILCDYCEDYGFKNWHGLKVHVAILHRGEATFTPTQPNVKLKEEK